MKQFTTLNGLKSFDTDLYEYLAEAYASLLDDGGDLDPNSSIMDFAGGDIFVIESFEDLHQIKTCLTTSPSFEETTRYLDITETADSFDACTEILKGKYVEIFLAVSNAGGPIYFVPKEVVEECPNITNSIEMTKNFWNSNENRENISNFRQDKYN